MPYSTPKTQPDVLAQQHFYVIKHCMYDYRALAMNSLGYSSANNNHARQYLVRLEELTAAQDDSALRVQKALSFLSGAQTGHMSEEGALSCLDPIITPLKLNKSSTTNEAICAQAHSIACYAYYRKYMASQEDLNHVIADAKFAFDRSNYQENPVDRLDNILKAACHATHAAARGFVSPAVLMAGCALRGLAAQAGVDMRLIPFYRPLWRATERWIRAVTVLVKSGQERGSVRTCAAYGCVLMKKTSYVPRGTRPFGCYCAHGTAPWYCSPECQDQDWMRHQAWCISVGLIPPPKAVQKQYGLVYNVLSAMYVLNEPLTRAEAMDEGDIQGDPLDGVATGTVAAPCPFGTPGKQVVYVMRHYPCQRR